MSTVKIYIIGWKVKGGGPSPADNYRTEIYFAGCQKAREGNPCMGCANVCTWEDKDARPLEVQEVYEDILRRAERGLPKYITFVGGEPTDQQESILELAELLKQAGFHILMFSWHSRSWFEEHWTKAQLGLFDIIITEPYVQEQHIYDWSLDDGLHNTVGSANQYIWAQPGRENVYVAAGTVQSLCLDERQSLTIIRKEEKVHV